MAVTLTLLGEERVGDWGNVKRVMRDPSTMQRLLNIDVSKISRAGFKTAKMLIRSDSPDPNLCSDCDAFTVENARSVSIAAECFANFCLVHFRLLREEIKKNWRPRKKRNNNATSKYFLGDEASDEVETKYRTEHMEKYVWANGGGKGGGKGAGGSNSSSNNQGGDLLSQKIFTFKQAKR